MFHLFTKVLSLLTIYIDFVHQTCFTKRTKKYLLTYGKKCILYFLLFFFVKLIVESKVPFLYNFSFCLSV